MIFQSKFVKAFGLLTIAALVLMCSCREDDHPDLPFLPCAQVSFVDSIIEIDLRMVDLSIQAMLRATVSSPVGLAKVQIEQVNKISANIVDTVVIQEITSFSNASQWTINENVELAGYTVGINIKAFDRLGQMSQRVLPVQLYNTKLRPAITWLNANGTVNSSYTSDGITVKMYGTTPSIPSLRAKIESRNGNEWSWGLDDISTYLVYADGTQEAIDEATRNFSANPCSGCRNEYEIASFTPSYSNEVKQIKLVATDLKMQKTESYINVQVYETYTAPNIMFSLNKLMVDDNDLSQAVVTFDVTSEDIQFNRFVYYLVYADGTVDSIGVKTSGFNHPRADPTASDRVNFQLPTVENVSAFRLKVVNAQGAVSEKDLPIEVLAGQEGVKHLRNRVIHTYDDRKARTYVYSVASDRMYMDGDDGSASVGVADADIVFRSSNDAYIYPDSPSANTSSTWKGDKTRKTFYVKVTPDYGINFETATKEEILKFDSIIDRMGEVTVSAANRPKKSLIALVKTTVVDDQGRLLSVVESDNVVDQIPGKWGIVRVNYNNDTRISTYASIATRDEAAMDITYAFKTHDGTVGLLKITEGLAYQPGINAASVRLQRQRITFSIKTAVQ